MAPASTVVTTPDFGGLRLLTRQVPASKISAHRGHSARHSGSFLLFKRGAMSSGRSGLGRGLTFDVPDWRQGSISVEPTAEEHGYSILFHAPYRTYREHAPPMQETTVDITKHVLKEDVLSLVGKSALMAFWGARPEPRSLLMFGDDAQTPAPSTGETRLEHGPWSSRGDPARPESISATQLPLPSERPSKAKKAHSR